MKIAFSSRAWEEYQFWISQPDTLARLNALIRECMRTPFTGTGKPEPLRGDFQGWWSRRITIEHRLVYRITGKPPDQALEIAQCRFHYDK